VVIEVTDRSHPEVIEAALLLIGASGGTIQSQTAWLGDETVGLMHLWTYLINIEPHDSVSEKYPEFNTHTPELNNKLKAKAKRTLEALFNDFYPVPPQLVLVCPHCSLVRGECRCPWKVMSVQPPQGEGVNYYDWGDYWTMVKSTLVTVTRQQLGHLSHASRERLLGFIEYLKEQDAASTG